MDLSRRARRGTSLIELLVTIAIIAIVLSIVVAVLSKAYRVVEGFRSVPPPQPATTTAA